MYAITDVLRTVDHEIHLGWKHVREWAESVFTKETIADVAVVVSTVTVLAVMLFALTRAVQNHTIEGISPYASSLNCQQPTPGF
jgi:hypothetical protein